MKKFGIVIFLSILIQAVFAEEPVYAPIGLGSSDEYNFVFHDGKEFYVKNQLNGNYAKIPDKYISISDGHIIISYPYNGIGDFKFKNVLVIPGEYYSVEMNYPGEGKKRSDEYYEVVSGKKTGGSYPFDKNVKTSSTSYYTETVRGYKIDYSPENLFKFIQYLDHSENVYRYSIPWVEGKDDYGIGESISFVFEKEVSAFNIINGYVDPYNLSLFKNNSRVKKLKIENLTSGKSWFVDFEDKIYINRIISDSPSKSYKITIMEVYEGRKYKDTCITAIFSDTTWWKANEKASTYYKDYKSGTLVDFNDLNKRPYIDPNDPVYGK